MLCYVYPWNRENIFHNVCPLRITGVKMLQCFHILPLIKYFQRRELVVLFQLIGYGWLFCIELVVLSQLIVVLLLSQCTLCTLEKGVPSAVGFPHCAGSGEGLSLSPKPYPHKCAEAGARTRDLPVTDGRLYRCTRPALLIIYGLIYDIQHLIILIAEIVFMF